MLMRLRRRNIVDNSSWGCYRHYLSCWGLQADELAAFANSVGGICVLGVNDQREVLGIPLEQLDLVENFVRQRCCPRLQQPMLSGFERVAQSSTKP